MKEKPRIYSCMFYFCLRLSRVLLDIYLLKDTTLKKL